MKLQKNEYYLLKIKETGEIIVGKYNGHVMLAWTKDPEDTFSICGEETVYLSSDFKVISKVDKPE